MMAHRKAIFNWTEFCGPLDQIIWDEKNLQFGLCFLKGGIEMLCFLLLSVTSAYYIGYQCQWVMRKRWHLIIIYIRMVAVISSLILVILNLLLATYQGKERLHWVDTLSIGFQVMSWLVHLGYVSSIKTHISSSIRGRNPVIFSWLLVFLYSVNYVRAIWFEDQSAAKDTKRTIAILYLSSQILYLCTLIPEGNSGSSQYLEFHCDAYERSSPLAVSSSAYSRFQEVEDSCNLGVAEYGINFLSYLTFYWVNPLLYKGAKGHLRSVDDLYELPHFLKSSIVSQRFKETLNKLVEHHASLDECNRDNSDEPRILSPSHSSGGSKRVLVEKYMILKGLRRTFGMHFLYYGLLKIFVDLLGFAGPLLLCELVKFMEEKSATHWKGFTIVALMCGSSFLASLSVVHYNYLLAKLNVQVRCSLITTVYNKLFQVNSCQLSKFSTGTILNMMSTDSDRIVNLSQSIYSLISLPIQLLAVLILLYYQIGISFVVGLSISALLVPLNRILAVKIARFSTDMMKFKDRRVAILSEVLRMIKMVKLNAWESVFKRKINDERFEELQALAGLKYLDAVCVVFWATVPVTVPVATFCTYAALGNDLLPSKIFTAIALLNMLNMPLNAFPWAINGLVEAWISIKRLENFIQVHGPDLNEYYTIVPELCQPDSGIHIVISDASFTCDPQVAGVPDGLRRKSRTLLTKRRGKKVHFVSTSIQAEEFDAASSSEEATGLNSISLQVKRGMVIGVVGQVGSGKTLLLHAILGELEKLDGVIAVTMLNQGFGYASQEVWIQNGTIKENIVFGRPFDISRYRSVLHACCLDDDLRDFPLKDETYCGENGSALSGGQKARVALARAVYQNKSVYLLDDVLASVDEGAAIHIMHNCIHGFLKSKTVILCTHLLNLLSRVDWVIQMKSGRICQQGPPSNVITSITGEVELNDDWWHKSLDSESSCFMKLSHDVLFKGHGKRFFNSDCNVPSGAADIEDQATSSLSYSVYLRYFKSVGWAIVAPTLMAILAMQASRNCSDLWLAFWVSNAGMLNQSIMLPAPVGNVSASLYNSNIYNYDSHIEMATFRSIKSVENNVQQLEIGQHNFGLATEKNTNYILVYSLFAGSNVVFALFRAFLFAYGGLYASKSLHKKLLGSVLFAKMQFFDFNPVGRILNRFSTDLYSVDDGLPFQFNIFLAQIFGLFGSVAVTLYGFPWIILLYVPVCMMYYSVQQYFRHTSRDLKRVYAVSLSPLYAHFSESIKGVTIIRASRDIPRFTNKLEELLEQNQQAQLSLDMSSQWLNFRLQLIGLVILAGVTCLSLIQKSLNIGNPGIVGLITSYALTLSGFLNAVVCSLAETEREMISVERINSYVTGFLPERAEGSITTPSVWPSGGMICFDQVFLKYHEYNPYSLCGVSFEISASEKIGIVGRTGAGKSSIFMALLRLVELSKGRILVDGIDVSMIDLKSLRSSFAIVSQDSLIFSGTLRENLDPDAKCSDTEIWRALRKCHLESTVKNFGGLDMAVGGTGSWLSAGEKQLFCLARALLRNAKIVCIDEGTAFLDNRTDALIQRSIQQIFHDKTVLIIAHRITTVQNCDRIFVMDKGHLVEWGAPSELLSLRHSALYSLIHSQ